MKVPTFKEYVREMYIANVDERIDNGEPVLQLKTYIAEFSDYLETEYDELYGAWL